MILNQASWNPGLVPGMALTGEEVKRLAEELVTFHEQFYDCFGRIEHQRLGLAYISGLMSKLEAKSAEPMALEFLGDGGVRPLQRFMKECRWDHAAMEAKHQALLSPLVTDAQGMINVDSCEFVKKGKESVGDVKGTKGDVGSEAT